MTWQKGISPNPGGLTPRQIALKRRLEGLTLKAADALEHALDAGTIGERIAAAKEVLDRAIGKAKQSGTIEVTHNASPHLVALTAMAAQTLARVQSVPENNRQPIDITPVHQKLTVSDHALNVANERKPSDERND